MTRVHESARMKALLWWWLRLCTNLTRRMDVKIVGRKLFQHIVMYDLEKVLQYHIFSPEWANLLNIQQDNVKDQITRGRQTVKRHQIGSSLCFTHSHYPVTPKPPMLPHGYFHLSNFAVKAPSAGSSCLIFSCLCLLLSFLPFSCWQDLIKAKVVLNLLCRVWACTSDSPFLPPELWFSVCASMYS